VVVRPPWHPDQAAALREEGGGELICGRGEVGQQEGEPVEVGRGEKKDGDRTQSWMQMGG